MYIYMYRMLLSSIFSSIYKSHPSECVIENLQKSMHCTTMSQEFKRDDIKHKMYFVLEV